MYLKICSMLDICEIENKEKGMGGGASGDGGAFSILPKEITIITRT